MKKFIKGILIGALLLTSSMAQDIEVFTTNNRDKKITTKSIEEAFKEAGFFISANRDMNTPFQKQFKQSDFEVYNLFTFYDKDLVLKLAKKYPNIGLFTPMSMSIYTKKGDHTISVASLSTSAMQTILQIPNQEPLLNELHAKVISTLKKAMPQGKFIPLNNHPLPPKGERITSYTMEMDNEEWEDELEDFKMGFEGELAPNGFVIAGHNNLGDEFEENNMTLFDFYEVYSICKLPVIYTIAKSHPEAGAFAPCSLYLAKPKDKPEMTVAFPSVYNWLSSMGIKDKNDTTILEDAQKRMQKILLGLTE